MCILSHALYTFLRASNPAKCLQNHKILLPHRNNHGEARDNENDCDSDGVDEGYLHWASSRPPRDDPQMEKPMAITPFQKPSSLAVMWWSNRKRGNMVTAPCSPVYTVTGQRGGQRGEKGEARVKYIINTLCIMYCMSLTKHFFFHIHMWDTSWIHTPIPITVKYDEDVVPNCLACKTEQHGFPEMTTAESNTAH